MDCAMCRQPNMKTQVESNQLTWFHTNVYGVLIHVFWFCSWQTHCSVSWMCCMTWNFNTCSCFFHLNGENFPHHRLVQVKFSVTGYCEGDGYRVGFGECSGKVLPALPLWRHGLTASTKNVNFWKEPQNSFFKFLCCNWAFTLHHVNFQYIQVLTIIARTMGVRYSPSNKDTPSVKQLSIRVVSFSEREHHMHSYLPRICVLF